MSAAFYLPIIASFVGGYFLGSIPFGLIVTRFAGAGDIRAIGSGNIGATNVLRTGRKELAVATLIGDALKGALAVLLAKHFVGTEAGAAAALGAFIGHLFPVWLKFKGGKGVAVYIGALIGLGWPAALAYCLAWLVVAVVTRYSSLAGLVASAAPPIYFWMADERALSVLSVFFLVVLLVTHRANIGRLLRGEEPRIGSKAEPKSAAARPDVP
jgi:glycerol-3-phosphate acyltransferase PlsY